MTLHTIWKPFLFNQKLKFQPALLFSLLFFGNPIAGTLQVGLLTNSYANFSIPVPGQLHSKPNWKVGACQCFFWD